MSTIISCTACERKLRIPDELLGQKVKCPSCSLQFTAVAVGAEASTREANGRDEGIAGDRDEDDRPARRSRRDEDDYDDDRRGRRRRDEDDYDDDRRGRRRDEDEDDYDDRRPRRRRDEDDYDDRPRKQGSPKEGWKKVGLGLTLISVSNWVVVGTWGLLAFTHLMSICGVMASALYTILSVVRLLTEVGEVVLLGLGASFCLAVPAPPRGSSPLKPLALTTFILACVQALFLVVAVIVALSSSYVPFAVYSLAMPMTTGAMIVTILEYLVALAAIILLLLFLGKVATTAREKSLAGESQTLLFGFSGYYALGGICYLIPLCASGSVSSMESGKVLGIIIKILGGMTILAAIGVRVWFFSFLGKMQDAVNRCRRRA